MTSPDFEEKLRKLESVSPSDAQRLWALYVSSEGEGRREVDQLLDLVLFQRLQKNHQERIFLDPPTRSDCAGEYVLGDVLYPAGYALCPFGLRENEWTRHVLICGMTGTGKTNLSLQILREFRRNRRPFLVFDWKRNYRDLLQLPDFSDLAVLTVGREIAPFRFNPLIPPSSVEPGQWLMKLVDVIKHAYFVGEGVEYLLREAIDWVYEKAAQDGKTPTFERVKDYVYKKHLQGRMSLWKASALRVLESLCFRHGLGPVVNCPSPLSLRLLEQAAILELDALSDADKIFLTEAMILWLYEFRKSEGRRETFKHALVIEEAHHVLSHKKENVEGAETIMETCLRQIREFGEAVVVIDQEPSKLSNSIKANTYCKITFNLGSGRDVLDISECMSLNQEEAGCIPLLEVGHGIAVLRGRAFVPLHLRLPKVNIQKGAIQDEVLLMSTSGTRH